MKYFLWAAMGANFAGFALNACIACDYEQRRELMEASVIKLAKEAEDAWTQLDALERECTRGKE